MKPILTLLLFLPVFAKAQIHYAGWLDSSFGINGNATIANISAQALQVTTGDQLLVAGSDYNGMTLTRFTKDGNIDPTFCTNGTDYISLAIRKNCFATSMLVQPDGKIVIAGGGYDTAQSANNTHSDFLVVRLNADGSLDTTFNHTGATIAYFPSQINYIKNIALQPDGRIIACGELGNDVSICVVRFNTDGSIDTNFHHYGSVSLHFGTGFQNANAMVLQPDGKILIGGNEMDEADFYTLLIRINADGSLDTTFKSSHPLQLPFGGAMPGVIIESISYWMNCNLPYYSGVNTIQLLPNGKFLVAGTGFGPDTTLDFALVQYNSNGDRDSLFGNASEVKTDFGGNDTATAITIAPDGKIIVAGNSYNQQHEQAIARYNADGTPDSTFGDGAKIHYLAGVANYLNDVKTQSNGKIVVAGNMIAASNGNYGLLTRYEAVYNTGIRQVTTPGIHIKAYPNPTTNGIFSLAISNYSGIASVSISDIQGKIILTNIYDFGASSVQSIDLKQYPPGIYNLQAMTTSGSIQTIKLVKE